MSSQLSTGLPSTAADGGANGQIQIFRVAAFRNHIEHKLGRDLRLPGRQAGRVPLRVSASLAASFCAPSLTMTRVSVLPGICGNDIAKLLLRGIRAIADLKHGIAILQVRGGGSGSNAREYRASRAATCPERAEALPRQDAAQGAAQIVIVSGGSVLSFEFSNLSATGSPFFA